MIKIKTYWISLVLLWAGAMSLSAQEDEDKNLVKNGSFEQMHDCPNNTMQFYKTKYWSSPNQGWGYVSTFDNTDINLNGSNPDLFALCNNYNIETDSLHVSHIDVNPFEGDNFAGLRTNYRDIVNNSPFFSRIIFEAG
jgi:hypothetical protein